LKRSGYIISIEGIDAVGKHTQSLLLDTWLRKRGHETAMLSFPDYKTPIGREIRAFLAGRRTFLPELQHMLFAANRWEKVPLIKDYQNKRKTIIINRYSESNIVYGIANGLNMQWLTSIEEGMPKSDTVLVLDAPPTDLLSRRRRQGDSYEKNSGLQLRARELYKELAPCFGWKVVDADLDVKRVHKSVVEVVKKQMKLGERRKRL
jgi:dTMP kinase